MTKKALITGINGFVGSHLAEACLAKGWAVAGTVRSFRSSLKNIKHVGSTAVGMQTYDCDIVDYLSIADVVRRAKPDYVFHLAAQSFVPMSWKAPRQTIETNVLGTLNVLEAVRREKPDAAVHFAGSSEEYGFVRPEDCPITEQQPLCPLSPYGVSKASADYLARQYWASHGLRVVVTRAFNHSGPRRGHAFAESDWAMRIALAESGKGASTIPHGSLDAVRDYTDVRDIVQGYILAVERGEPGHVYNLCSGKHQAPAMKEVLGILKTKATVPITALLDSSRMRPSDVPRLIGDASKAEKDLGWVPERSLDSMLTDLLNYWRTEVSGQHSSNKAEALCAP